VKVVPSSVDDVAEHHSCVAPQSAQFRALHRRVLERSRELLLRHREELARELTRVLPRERVARAEGRVGRERRRELDVGRADFLGDVSAKPF